MRRLLATLVAITMLAATPALANPAEVGRALPGAQKVGEARYTLLAISLFRAELFTATGNFSWERPFALTLNYERDAPQSVLINRTVREMSQRGGVTSASLAPLRAQLTECFPNILRGDRITGVSTGANTARFYHNGSQSCEINWPGFRRNFFGIWLDGRDGTAARLSAELRGES
jgi:hypothetical protein